jgi:hypothetical protein
MKEWPDNPSKWVYAEDLIEPVVEAIRFAYDLKRKNEDKDIPYEGYNIGRRDLATCLPVDEHLSAKNLKYSEEDQGRDPLQEIVLVAFQLGVEQGRRIEHDEMQLSMSSLQRWIKLAPEHPSMQKSLEMQIDALMERIGTDWREEERAAK